MNAYSFVIKEQVIETQPCRKPQDLNETQIYAGFVRSFLSQLPFGNMFIRLNLPVFRLFKSKVSKHFEFITENVHLFSIFQ